jgi:hypothetical protein
VLFRSVFFKSKNVVLGQTVDEVDDLGLSRNLDSNHFKTKKTLKLSIGN